MLCFTASFYWRYFLFSNGQLLVEKTEEFAGAFERAQASGKPALIEIKLDPEAITPAKTLTDIREKR